MRAVIGVVALGLCASCGTKAVEQGERVFVISSEEAGTGGNYLRPSSTGEAVSDVDGNLVEDVMRCGFIDIRVVDEPGRLHGSGLAVWVPERAISNLQRNCLAKELPKNGSVVGPVPTFELMQRLGL